MTIPSVTILWGWFHQLQRCLLVTLLLSYREASDILLDLDINSDTSFKNAEDLSSSKLIGVSNSNTRPTHAIERIFHVDIHKDSKKQNHP